jgi:ADP-ribosyl-[dinitrogen reductase] hydrolase
MMAENRAPRNVRHPEDCQRFETLTPMTDTAPLPRLARDSDLRARCRGSLLGGAIGDALGAAVEFLDRRQIAERFGPGGIRDYAPAYGRAGAITDDTQMALFTAEGMLRAHVRAVEMQRAPELGRVMSGAYQRWLRAIGLTDRADEVPDRPGWLIGHDELHRHRSPGTTCVPSLLAQQRAGDPARNDSKGCGGVMRVAPVGLYFAALAAPRAPLDPDAVFAAGVEVAALTHGHPTAQLAAGCLAALTALLARGGELSAGIERIKRTLRQQAGHDEVLHEIERAQTLAAQEPMSSDAVDRLGPGWAGDEALAVALYCALCAPDFEAALVLAVNHGGDSDSTGSITGSLLGARDGAGVLPPRWLDRLELEPAIGAIADDLAAVGEWALHGDDRRELDFYRNRYPGF